MARGSPMSAQVHQAAVFPNQQPVVRASNVEHFAEAPAGSYEAWIYPVHGGRGAFRAYVTDDMVCQPEKGFQEILEAQELQKPHGPPVVPPIRGFEKRIKHETLSRGHGGSSGFMSRAEEDLDKLSEALRVRLPEPATITEYMGPDPFEDTVGSAAAIGGMMTDSDESGSAFEGPFGNRNLSISQSDGGATSPSDMVEISGPYSGMDIPGPYDGIEKTTLMIRNLPVTATQQTLLKTWPADGTFDFLYMPFSFEKHRNLGYAFMNFVTHDHAVAFIREWHDKIPDWSNAKKKLMISWAVVQGRESIMAQLGKYKIARIKNIHYQPALFEGTQRVPLDYSLFSSGQTVRL